MRHTPGSLILGGDFNYTQTPAETTGNPNPSRALAELLRGIDLTDTWCQNPNTTVYTHYSQTGASRLDRIYVSRALLPRKVGTVILPVAFTDHQTVVLSVEIGEIATWRNRGKWNMNPTMLRDESFTTALRDKWKEWRLAKRHFPTATVWWERLVKHRLQILIRQYEAGKRRDMKMMEEHLYTCIYGILHSEMPYDKKRRVLQQDKARIVRLHSTRHRTMMLDMNETDALEGEEMSLYHYIENSETQGTENYSSDSG
jgi:hypothetical protein